VNSITLLEYEINRIKTTKKIDKIVVATSDKKADDKIEKLCKQISIDCFRGPEDDVLDRYYQCSLNYPEFNNIVRITGDCPLIDPKIIDQVIAFFEKGQYHYASNVLEETFPDGMDIEVFTRETLIVSAKNAKLNSEREHVTQYMLKNKRFKKGNFSAGHDWSNFRLTVDNQEDFVVISFLIKNCKTSDSYLDYISALTKHPEIMIKNMRLKRNEGLLKSLKNDFIVKK